MQSNVASRFSSGRSIELIASGVPSLDSTLGGGYPLGSVVLVIEDELGLYSDLFFKTFLSQGVVDNDTLLVASPGFSTTSFFGTLPGPADALSLDTHEQSNPNEPMVIAWRYTSMNPSSKEGSKPSSLSENFSFTKRFPPEMLIKKNIIDWYPPKNVCDQESLLDDLFKHLKASLVKHSTESLKSGRKSYLRIGIHHLGSVTWGRNSESITNFLFKLRWTIAQYPACVVVTLPANVIKNTKIVSRSQQICDVVFQLVAVDPNSNILYKDYNGLLRLHKIAPINSLVSVAEATDDWAFKLLKKKLLVERLTLPPELDTSVQREQVKEPLSCSSLKNTLDF